MPRTTGLQLAKLPLSYTETSLDADQEVDLQPHADQLRRRAESRLQAAGVGAATATWKLADDAPDQMQVAESEWTQGQQAASEERARQRRRQLEHQQQQSQLSADRQTEEDEDAEMTNVQEPTICISMEESDALQFRAPTQMHSPPPASTPPLTQLTPPSVVPPVSMSLLPRSQEEPPPPLPLPLPFTPPNGHASFSEGGGGSSGFVYTSSASSSQLESGSFSQQLLSQSQLLARQSDSHSQSYSEASPSETPPTSAPFGSSTNIRTEMALHTPLSEVGASKDALPAAAAAASSSSLVSDQSAAGPRALVTPTRGIASSVQKIAQQLERKKTFQKKTNLLSTMRPKPPAPCFDGKLPPGATVTQLPRPPPHQPQRTPTQQPPPQQQQQQPQLGQQPDRQQSSSTHAPPLVGAHTSMAQSKRAQPPPPEPQQPPSQPSEPSRPTGTPSSAFFSSSQPAASSTASTIAAGPARSGQNGAPVPPPRPTSTASTEEKKIESTATPAGALSQPQKKAPRDMVAIAQSRYEMYKPIFLELTKPNRRVEDVYLYTVAELQAVLKCNGVSLGKNKGECATLVWTLVSEGRLREPHEPVAKQGKKRSSSQRPNNRSLVSYATQPPDQYEEEDESTPFLGRRGADQIAYTQPQEEYEAPHASLPLPKRQKMALMAPNGTKEDSTLRSSHQHQSASSARTPTMQPLDQQKSAERFDHLFGQRLGEPTAAASQAAADSFSSSSFQPQSSAGASSLQPSQHSLHDFQSLPLPPPSVSSSSHRALRYSRIPHPVSIFQLRVGAEVVVVVPEYLRFRSAHRLIEDTLQQFHPPNAHAASTVSMLDLCRATGTGLLRAKVVSFIPILISDGQSHHSRRKHPTPAEWNKLYGRANDVPPSPWCALVCRLEAGGAATMPPSRPQHFTLYYLDQHWQVDSHLTPTAWQTDPATNLRHLASPNSAQFLLEGEWFDAAIQSDWQVHQLVAMRMVRQVQLLPTADGAFRSSQAEYVERVGRIIGIEVAAVDPMQVEYFHRSPFRCLQILWLTEQRTNERGVEYAIDMQNQDISSVSPWEVVPLRQQISLASWIPQVQLSATDADPLRSAINRALQHIHEVVFSSLHLQEFPRASMQSFYAHMLHTPTRALVRVREEFVKVLVRHAAGDFTHWSLFVVAMRSLVSQLLSAMNAHFQSAGHEDDAIPSLVPPGEEHLPPFTDDRLLEFTSDVAIRQRMQLHEEHLRTWREECPAGAAKVCAAFATYIERRMQREPTWVDAFGEMHIDQTMTDGRQEGERRARERGGSAESRSFTAVSEILKA